MSTWSTSARISLILSILNGVKERDTNVAILSPTFKSVFPIKASPIFSTVPNNIPPEPVTGFRCFPCLATISSIISAIFASSPLACSWICVKLAESIFNVCTSIKISLSYISSILLSSLLAG